MPDTLIDILHQPTVPDSRRDFERLPKVSDSLPDIDHRPTVPDTLIEMPLECYPCPTVLLAATKVGETLSEKGLVYKFLLLL